jgi:hypothetical protein
MGAGYWKLPREERVELTGLEWPGVARLQYTVVVMVEFNIKLDPNLNLLQLPVVPFTWPYGCVERG